MRSALSNVISGENRHEGITIYARLPVAISALLCATNVCLAQTWWDTDYAARVAVTVATSADNPDKGYNGYTARLDGLDTAALIASGELQADCDDLRLVYWDGATNTEIPRHLIGCNSANSDIRFAIQTSQAPSTADSGYTLYYNNPSAGTPPTVTPTNVYLWYDDASENRIASYDQGRGDPWHGTGWQDSFAYNAAGYYTFDTGDNFTDSFRRPVDERDVYVEAEFFHTGCYPLNMTSGPVARGIIASGANGSEQSNHYYAGQRGHNSACGGGYSNDGDIVEGQRTTTAVDGPNPPAIATNAWRRQGLATWFVNPTNLAYYDSDTLAGWGALGYPDAGALQVVGTDAADSEGRGFAGVIVAQDQGRVRNIVIRRYVENEPVVSLGAVEPINPELEIDKSYVFAVDADSDGVADVGDVIRYSYQVTNIGNVPITGVTVTDVTNGTGDQPLDGNAPDLAHPATGSLTDNTPIGDSIDADGANETWTTLGPNDSVTFTWDYVVQQGDIDTLQ